MQEASNAKTATGTARLTGFEDKKDTHGCLLIFVREVPYCSRFTHQASSVAGGLACFGPVKVPRGHSSDYFAVLT